MRTKEFSAPGSATFIFIALVNAAMWIVIAKIVMDGALAIAKVIWS